MSRDPKTPEQLEREIAYYRWEIARRTSADRVRRAQVAIGVRERQLAAARQLRPGLASDPVNNALQRVAGGARR